MKGNGLQLNFGGRNLVTLIFLRFQLDIFPSDYVVCASMEVFNVSAFALSYILSFTVLNPRLCRQS